MQNRWLRWMFLGWISLMLLGACQSGEEAEATAAATALPTLAATAIPPSPTNTAEPTATTEPEADPTETPMPTEAPEIVRTYSIVPEESEARFFIDEELFGEPKTVVGRTNMVTGQFMVDLNKPSEAEVSVIEINARDLTTDSSFRNRALRSQILDSAEDAYQFITFTPTLIEGLPEEPASLGEPLAFNLTGDLQIRDISNSVTFEMTATAVSETEISGFGMVMVRRADFDLNIPSVQGVANVSDDVRLEIEFVARAEET